MRYRLPLLFAVFLIVGVGIYWPALGGPFVSDDVDIIVSNPYVNVLTPGSVVALFDPGNLDQLAFSSNYAPVHMLATAIERNLFGDAVLGYHLVNVVLHAVNATLLVMLLLSSGIPVLAAALGGALFAVHPANVESVAWITQLKTSGALALSLGAILAHFRRPALGTGLFVLALLTKASAGFALPMAAALTWVRRGRPSRRDPQWLWLAVWCVLFVLYAIPELYAVRLFTEHQGAPYPDVWIQLRTVAAIGMRYLVMAATGYGVSTFQQPPPAASWLDPWWLAGGIAGIALSWRMATTLRRRSEEGAYWVGAAASFAPISQLIPFVYPMADRYLYFILPGLIGGVILLLRGSRLAHGALAAAAVLGVVFAVQSVARAGIWRDQALIFRDSAVNYPDGLVAHLQRAEAAARAGDAQATVEALQRAHERGFASFMPLTTNPVYGQVWGTPEYVEFVYDLAGYWIERKRGTPARTEAYLHLLAHAHLVRWEYDEAEAALEEAVALRGPQHVQLLGELANLRAARLQPER